MAKHHSSASLPPRKINVQKFAESRAIELQSLQSIVSNRINNDYRSQRSKRKRTTAFDNHIARKGCRNKRMKLGAPHKSPEEHDSVKEIPRRVRRRRELKMNAESGFCCSGDGTKRLRTHVWHAKRFAMTKLWGYHLPLGLQGRGKGSRALLRRLKQGVLVHDASYYAAVQLEGPEDSLASVLSMVLVPHTENNDDSVVSGSTYGTAMLYHVGAPASHSIAPVTYMWRPTLRQNMSTEVDERNHCTSLGDQGVSDESVKLNVDLCENSDRMKHGASFRQLWVWMHASAFDEGYDNLKLACQKEMEKRAISISCISLEGQLAKLDLMGSGTFQLLQKMLHIKGISENQWQVRKHVTSRDYVSQNKIPSILKNEEHFSSHAVLALNVSDPREFPRKGVIVPKEPISTEALADAQETSCNEELADMKVTLDKDEDSRMLDKDENLRMLDKDEDSQELDKDEDLPSSSWPKLENNQFDNDDLWYASTKGLRPPVDESVLSKEKHHKHMVNFCLDDIHSMEANTSTKVQCSRSCPILLLKNDKESVIGWSIILPLSWVKAFWIPLISNGAHAIGLREKHWIACEVGLPFFPLDFPDCKTYSCFKVAQAAAFYQKEELRPPSVRSLRVPILPPWGIVRFTFNRETSTGETHFVSAREHSTDADKLLNSGPGSSKFLSSGCDDDVFDGTVARTGCMLTTYLKEIKAGPLLLFPYAPEGKDRMSKFITGEVKLDPNHRNSVIYNHKLCFLRVHLRPFKEGRFEEGAVVCAPHPSDISIWTSRSGKSDEGLNMSQSAIGSYFKEHSSGKWGMEIPVDSIARKSHRWPIGFVTTASVQGSKRLVAEGFCEAVLLAQLREEQWKEMPVKQRRREIYVLVRNLRSTAYRLALASVVLEDQENDIDFL